MRAADGRVPGRRGRATRDRLLEATEALLVATSYRELKVVDIARKAGTSPATFYQYFAGVEDAILLLASRIAEEGEPLADVVRAAPWRGAGGYEAARKLADGFLRLWDDHQAVLRVVNLAIAEGDERFRAIRTRLLNPVTVALRDAVDELRARGRVPSSVDPAAQAAAIVSMLAHVAEHRDGLEAWGVRVRAARDSMARISYLAVTGRRPPGG